MSGGTVGPVDEAQLDALVGRYEWFTPARILRVLQTGRSDRRVSIAAVSRLLPLGRFTVDREALCALSPADLIDRFLKEGGHRIVTQNLLLWGSAVTYVRSSSGAQPLMPSSASMVLQRQTQRLRTEKT